MELILLRAPSLRELHGVAEAMEFPAAATCQKASLGTGLCFFILGLWLSSLENRWELPVISDILIQLEAPRAPWAPRAWLRSF